MAFFAPRATGVPEPRSADREAPSCAPAVAALPEPTAALSAARDATARLQRRGPWDDWLVSRIADQRFTVLAGSAGSLPVGPGDSFALDETLCSRLLAGAPAVAPRLADVPAYAGLPLVDELGVQAYAGAPILVRGRVHGTVCGIGLRAVDLSAEQVDDLAHAVRAEAAELAVAFTAQKAVLEAERRHDQLTAAAFADHLTALPDARGFDLLLAREEVRAARSADSVAVAVVGLGPVRWLATLQSAAEALVELAGPQGTVTRLDGRRFGLLLPGLTGAEVTTLLASAHDALRALGTAPTTAWQPRAPEGGLADAWRRVTCLPQTARR